VSSEKRDPEPLLVLAAMALEVAAAAPERFNKYGMSTVIPRELVQRIRTYAEQHGFDWRKVHRAQRAPVSPSTSQIVPLRPIASPGAKA